MMQPRRVFWIFAMAATLGVSCSTSSEDASSTATNDDGEELVSDADDVVDPAPATSTATTPPTTSTTSTTTTTMPEPARAVEINDAMNRGINFGNSLEAPREGDWGIGLDASYFEIVADAGFSHVRLPVSWAEYADIDSPFVIPEGDDPTIDHADYTNIWERVDWAIDQAALNGLIIIVNMHHYDAIHDDPLAERDRFLSMWTQIAERYSTAGDHVVFELLNEPHQTFDVEPTLWNDMAADALAIVRQTNPERPVLIGPVGYNAIDRLSDFEPPDDPNVIVTVHVYEPFPFTHQGATWVDPVPAIGARWMPTEPAFPLGVFNYSWDIEITPEGDDLEVEYQRQYAGFSLDYQRGVALTEVSFRSSGKADLRIVCRLPEGAETEAAIVTTTAEAESYTFDLRACSDESTGIFIQSTTGNSEPVTFESLVICSERGCEEMIQTESGAIDALLASAAEWAEANDVPMHVGEFGAYGADGAAPLDDRAAWTRAVQEAATSRGMSFAYWEFHSGFGAWNPETGEWIEPLRAALLD